MNLKQNAHLASLKAYIPGKSVKEIAALYNLNPADIVKLGSNENPFGVSSKALAAIKQYPSVNHEPAIYPDALSQCLTEALKEKFPEIGKAAIIAGNGMDNIIEGAARLLLEPDCKTLIHTPTFEYYEIVTRWGYAEPIFVNTRAENNFELDIDEYLDKLTEGVKIAYLCNPNNPTGNVLSWDCIKAVLQKASKIGAVVFLDEAYADFAGCSHIDKVQYFDNLIIGRTFSKIHGLAALRIGWGVLPDEMLLQYRKVQTPFSTNGVGLQAAIAALSDDEFQSTSIAKNTDGMNYLREELKGLGFKVFPSGGNFISFLVDDRFSGQAAQLCNQLLEKGIILRNASLFHGAPSGLVRATIGSVEQNHKVIQTIKSLLSNI